MTRITPFTPAAGDLIIAEAMAALARLHRSSPNDLCRLARIGDELLVAQMRRLIEAGVDAEARSLR